MNMPLEVERYELYAEPTYQFELDRRSFLQMVGGGLVVLSFLSEAPAQQRRGFGGGSASQELGAWLHIAEDGTITGYTGKVEVGQNARTSLTQAVAEELRVAPASVRVVMADTARVPYDGGTAGSRTTPDMFAQMRRAAATARELLIDRVAEQAKVDRAGLVVADGKVTHGPSKRSWTFGELTHGQKLVKTVGREVALTAPADWKLAGHSVAKVEGQAIVTGGHKYASDIKRPGMLFGKVLRPAGFGATLVSVDTKEAAAMPGVVVVHDGNFIGVAAPDEHRAEQALLALKAEWKTTPQPSSRELFDYLKKNRQDGQAGGGGRAKGGGSGPRGSIEKGLAAADHKLSATYTIAYIAHTPLEPRAAVAEWEGGKLTVWTGTQRPFGVRGDLATAFRLQPDQVHVIVPDTGSGYGGKHTVETTVEAARLAKAAGKPVKVVWTREEEFTWAYFRPAGVIDINSGVNKDGTITAWEAHNYNSGGSGLQPLYEIANQRSDFHSTRSPLKQGSYRALASTANHFARESHIDDLARLVSMDPLAFRLKNLKNERQRGVLEAAAKQFGWPRTKAASGQGFGIACGFEKNGYVASCAEVAIDRGEGQVRVVKVVTAFDCGAIVNPDHLKNQIEGAVMMGLGGALYEEIRFEDGKILNPRFSRYRVPRFSDLPVLESVLVERKDVPSAGAGEAPIVAVAPAVGNAIVDACGMRIRSLPMVPNGLKVANAQR